MEKTLKEHLIDTFDDLGEVNLKRFKDRLCDREKEPRVRRSQIEKIKDTWDLADLLVDTFTSRDAPAVTIEVLEAIRCNEQAVNLKKATEQTGAHGSSGRQVSQGSSRASSSGENGKHFIDKHRVALIGRANNVDPILDELLQMDIIGDHDYDEIRSKNTSSQKMRDLLSGPIKSAGKAGKDALYGVLKRLNVHLVRELEGQ